MPSEWKPNQQKFGAKYKVLGKDYATPDLYAKVTGQAKYCGRFSTPRGCCSRSCCLSPVPHGRVRHLDFEQGAGDAGEWKAVLTQMTSAAPPTASPIWGW
jgi:CO/xanthine dehydrogenase Mo-binding subunit